MCRSSPSFYYLLVFLQEMTEVGEAQIVSLKSFIHVNHKVFIEAAAKAKVRGLFFV